MSIRSERKNKMKNILKKLFSLTFALLILLSLIPFSAFSAEKEITSIALKEENYVVTTVTNAWIVGRALFIPFPEDADDSGVRLYYADTDKPVTVYDEEEHPYGLVRYIFEEKGIYMVYAMDSKTGVRSEAMQFNIAKEGADEIRAKPEKMPTLTAGEPFIHQYYSMIYSNMIVRIRLYYADTDLPVEGNKTARYIINEPGEYRAYYMDEISGVKSEEFTLVVKSPDNPQTSDRIFTPIIIAATALLFALAVLKSRKYE